MNERNRINYSIIRKKMALKKREEKRKQTNRDFVRSHYNTPVKKSDTVRCPLSLINKCLVRSTGFLCCWPLQVEFLVINAPSYLNEIEQEVSQRSAK
jgi:hypothetical protein